MISIVLNDEVVTVSIGTSLVKVLEHQTIALDAVAIALNSEVVPRSRWPHIVCQQDDQLEVFSVVAGG
ncbi:sulfur carrier protein ThiS [Shewanella sp. GutDb-MelDb]|uniref:sulfur carrier protein ThiS n=1 Tax=Shewanella sp. GutDb-MelDb TaxID=2058316 RepID=UPI000C79F2C2|nr:sulfur carrier protein ThiS [Shewanella sp. GutDb-MelDb]PKG58956.1 thiamine biosynthesis protein ThiS [Shewanella sp. GutDb-MelDb]